MDILARMPLTVTDPANYRRTLYDAFSRHYREASDEWTNDRQMRFFAGFVRRHLALPYTTSVLDVGCGSGLDVEYLSQFHQSVVGLDIFAHDNWTAILQRRPNARFQCVDLISYATNDKYDLILDNGCLHHQHPKEYSLYLHKIRSLASRQAYYVLSTFKNATSPGRIDHYGRLHRYFADHELNERLTADGFDVVDEHSVFRPLKRDYYRFSICRTRG